MDTNRKELVTVSAKCQCGHLNIHGNAMLARLNNKCMHCHTYLSFDEFKYADGVSINQAMGEITCKCGKTFIGKDYMHDCPACYRLKLDAKKERMNG